MKKFKINSNQISIKNPHKIHKKYIKVRKQFFFIIPGVSLAPPPPP